MDRDEIRARIQHNRSLETLSQQERGELRDMSQSDVWCARREGIPMASGTTRQEVEQAVQRLVPQHTWPLLYTLRSVPMRPETQQEESCRSGNGR